MASLKIDAQALQRTPGEDPATAMQEYVDLFDTDFDAVGYSPVTLRGTMGDSDELRNYGLYYRADRRRLQWVRRARCTCCSAPTA